MMLHQCESAQIICFPGPKNPGRTTYQNPSFCALAFFWMEYVWMMSAVPNLQKWRRMGSPMEKRYLFLNKKTTGKRDNWRSWTYHQSLCHSGTIDLQCYINTANTESAKKVQKHVVTFTPGPTSKCVSKNIPFQRAWRCTSTYQLTGKDCFAPSREKLWKTSAPLVDSDFNPLLLKRNVLGMYQLQHWMVELHVAEAICWSPDSNVWGFVSTQVTCPFT